MVALGLTLTVDGVRAEPCGRRAKDIVITAFDESAPVFMASTASGTSPWPETMMGTDTFALAGVAEFDPAHAGHSHVGYDAAALDLRQCVEKAVASA
jgi:hypothetical protein